VANFINNRCKLGSTKLPQPLTQNVKQDEDK
jgi:hypothetical protein